MDLKEYLAKTRDERSKKIENSQAVVAIKQEEEEHQKAPSLITIGEKVKSFAKPEDMMIPEKSGMTVFHVKPNQEKIDFMISWAEVTKSAILEPAASVLGKIIKTKGVVPEEYGEDKEKGLADAETEIVNLALEHGVKPLFYKEDGQPEDGVFVIPGKGIVFVEQFQSADLSDKQVMDAAEISTFKKYEAVKAMNPDLLLPKDEESPFSSNWKTETNGRVSGVALANNGENYLTQEKPEDQEIIKEDAPKTISLEAKRQEIEKMMFRKDPGTVTRITAFLQEEVPVLPPATNNELKSITSPGQSGDSGNEQVVDLMPGTQFVPKVATGFTWADNKDQVS